MAFLRGEKNQNDTHAIVAIAINSKIIAYW
jgi:hypothetical protein